MFVVFAVSAKAWLRRSIISGFSETGFSEASAIFDMHCFPWELLLILECALHFTSTECLGKEWIRIWPIQWLALTGRLRSQCFILPRPALEVFVGQGGKTRFERRRTADASYDCTITRIFHAYYSCNCSGLRILKQWKMAFELSPWLAAHKSWHCKIDDILWGSLKAVNRTTSSHFLGISIYDKRMLANDIQSFR